MAVREDIEEVQKKRDQHFTVASTVTVSESDKEPSALSIDPEMLQSVQDEDDVYDDGRKTELFCSVCCDVLRACIICNIIYLTFTALGLLLSWLGFSLLSLVKVRVNQLEDDDDAVEELQNTLTRWEHYQLVAVIQLSCGVFFASIGIFGASRFKQYLVLATGIWYCLDVVINLCILNFIGVVVVGLFAYPHFSLFVALRCGTISRKNYMTERYCCCDAKD